LRSGDHLSVQENDEAPQELLPESDVDFFSTSSDDAYTFKLDSQGHVSAMILHVDKDLEMKRIE
jgi:hypothetical protein